MPAARHRPPFVRRYLQWLEQQAGAAGEAEWQQFINCLTTNLTSFFREEHHFRALAGDLKARTGRPLRLWCSAASTGEEPYSIAMTLVETLGPLAHASVLATDIDTDVLAIGQRGIYEAGARGLGAERGRVRVKPELARLIQFRPFNLMARSWSTLGEFDIVFCAT